MEPNYADEWLVARAWDSVAEAVECVAAALDAVEHELERETRAPSVPALPVRPRLVLIRGGRA